MKKNNVYDLVYHYYKQIIFIFVPNICNSRCSFCYIKPVFSKNAVLSNIILIKTENFVDKAINKGFNEFRITGGEPLLYDNISELFSIFKKKNVSYTLLTNGININKHFDIFEKNRPKKITIGYHSKINYSSVFGINYNTDILDENICELCKRKFNITISVLFLEENKNDIISHILHLKSLGVNSIKLIYPNNKKIKMSLMNEFIKTTELVKSISGIDVRYSDLKNNICSMDKRGFLSFFLDNNKIFGCCNSINNEKLISNINSSNDLEATILNFYNVAKKIKEFPCKNNVKFCPIALNK